MATHLVVLAASCAAVVMIMLMLAATVEQLWRHAGHVSRLCVAVVGCGLMTCLWLFLMGVVECLDKIWECLSSGT